MCVCVTVSVCVTVCVCVHVWCVTVSVVHLLCVVVCLLINLVLSISQAAFTFKAMNYIASPQVTQQDPPMASSLS